MRSSSFVVATAALSALSFSTPPAAQAQKVPCTLPSAYEVVELAGLGGPTVQALALGEDGQAAGWSLDAGWTSRAVLWSGRQPASLSPTTESGASGISSDGRVAGWQRTSSVIRGTTWSSTGMRYLTPLSGHVGCVAADINRDGWAVGWSVSAQGDGSAVVWHAGQARNLNTGQGPRPYVSYAFSINDSGTIVGRGHFSTAPATRALAWNPGGARVLPGLGGGSDGAVGISPNGNIVGGSLSAQTSKFHAVLWQGSTVRDLGLFQGVHPTAAFGVNDCGMAVGEAVVDVFNARTVAVIWQNGRTRELNRLIPFGTGWNLHTARAINGRGEILGYGYRTGYSGLRAYLLTPVY